MHLHFDCNPSHETRCGIFFPILVSCQGIKIYRFWSAYGSESWAKDAPFCINNMMPKYPVRSYGIWFHWSLQCELTMHIHLLLRFYYSVAFPSMWVPESCQNSMLYSISQSRRVLDEGCSISLHPTDGNNCKQHCVKQVWSWSVNNK